MIAITGTAGAGYWLSATTKNESHIITAIERDFHIKACSEEPCGTMSII
ncbi:MAG: hypothetical protein HQK62_02070 [Desulfamplus sp.]|nr:hypothetical protein [Desulfamplus sp.]